MLLKLSKLLKEELLLLVEFSLKMLVTLAREKVRLSQEVHNLYDTFAYKSPKKRTREVMEEIEEESHPSVRWWEKF
ncbi:hypothetical protein GBA52_010031 [Prunus armeniaca]|nr:hypothetical protein GBA52_010031 [Prunus armeniaca]